VVRFKLFTLDERLVLRRIGLLSKADRRKVWQEMNRIIG